MTGMDLPPAPVNVRLANATDELPVDCRYVGIVDGVHEWEVIVTDQVAAFPATTLRAERLPAKTGIRFPADNFAPAPGTFTCPRCGRTSHHPDDIREGYCGACHDWTGR